jgi:2-polyprenyl-3-methyl-5-hydroxy-6-metoxy-1,4-benzoquinol methylase
MSAYFDALATSWDSQEFRVERARIIAERIGEQVPMQGKRVLDFGCGTGLLGFHWASSALELAMADVSAGMLEQVRIKAQTRGLEQVRALNLSEEALVGKFNVIASLLALHHIDDVTSTIRMLSEHLEVGGALCLCDLDSEDGSFHGAMQVPHLGFDRNALLQLLLDCGLRDVSAQTVFTERRAVGADEKDYTIFMIWGYKS